MASHFFLRGQEKVTKKKATLHPRIPRSLNLPGGRRKLGSLYLIFKEGEPQTSAPLIRPADPAFGGPERGKVKPGQWDKQGSSSISFLVEVFNDLPSSSFLTKT
jgi:hypothetical protein